MGRRNFIGGLVYLIALLTSSSSPSANSVNSSRSGGDSFQSRRTEYLQLVYFLFFLVITILDGLSDYVSSNSIDLLKHCKCKNKVLSWGMFRPSRLCGKFEKPLSISFQATIIQYDSLSQDQGLLNLCLLCKQQDYKTPELL